MTNKHSGSVLTSSPIRHMPVPMAGARSMQLRHRRLLRLPRMHNLAIMGQSQRHRKVKCFWTKYTIWTREIYLSNRERLSVKLPSSRPDCANPP